MSPQGLVHRGWRPGKETEQPVGQRLIGEGRHEEEEKRPQHRTPSRPYGSRGTGAAGVRPGSEMAHVPTGPGPENKTQTH